MSKKWIIKKPDPETVHELFNALRISPVTAHMLVNRGLRHPKESRQFIEPSLHQLIDPSQHSSLSHAASHLMDKAQSGAQITIYGDYDADGICATSVMVRALKKLGANVDYYVPARFDEGYGLNADALTELHGKGTDTVVTVDCGVSAVEAVKHASTLGLEVIITDHHEPGDSLPDTPYVLNPHLDGCDFGYQRLAGVGVAFKLAWAMGQQMNGGANVADHFRDIMVELLPLVAIGTIADMVELTDENRVLAEYGLRVMPTTKNPGLKALLDVAGASDKDKLRSYHVGFQLAPRLNAVGRMSDAKTAIEMFTTDDQERAVGLAKHLEKENRRRRKVQKRATEEAIDHVESTIKLDETHSIVISSEDWHPGVVGLVASRLAENFWRPAFVFCEQDELARGSARSIPGFHLYDALSKCGHLLERYGGHEGAAGLTLHLENLDEFRRTIDDIIAQELDHEPPIPRIELEGEVELAELTRPVVKELDMLSPYGMGNPEPMFCAREVTLAGNPQIVGSRQNHLSFMVRQDNTTLKVIAFGKADWLEDLKQHGHEPFSIAFEPRLNTWRNRTNVELRGEDLQFPGEENIEFTAE
ncbi:MAG: single-stranded-DNA-specific exonuclease RecJ [Planctomycetota bacterium]